MSKAKLVAALAVGACVSHAPPARAQQGAPNPPSALDAVQVTATRFGDTVQEVPASISIITSEELKARNVNDLRTALALLGGVNVALGGDAGPVAALPGLLGLREADDFLLLIDGIPAGGAFTPPFELVTLTNVERIEVLRGAAPVYMGTTAFAGTINVIHFPAGEADSTATLSYGSYGSLSARGARVLSDGPVLQSLSGEVYRNRYSDPRANADLVQGRYRAATAMAGGEVRLDLNVTLLHQKPASPTPVDDSGHLTSDLPVDFNQNPADAKLNTDAYQMVLGFDKTVSLGRWGTTFSVTRTKVDTNRGFLIDGYADVVGDNAVGAVQSRWLTDIFFDTHITDRPASWWAITYGLNEVYGRASQSSRSFGYFVPLDGSTPQDSASGTPQGTSSLNDRRSLFGVYTQSRFELSKQASILAGLRWNNASETRDTSDDTGSADQHEDVRRWSGSLGGQVKVWSDKGGELEDVQLYASVGDTFQLPELDFGPDAGQNPLLKPETERSLEMGIKADGLDGRLDLDLTAFFVDFANQPITSEIAGTPTLIGGGENRYRGVEFEATYNVLPFVTLNAQASYNDIRYRDFTTVINGETRQLAGNRLPLSPVRLAAAGVTIAPPLGWRGSLTLSYVGPRYLDRINTVQVGGYTVVDASIGYNFPFCGIALQGTNLSNRRDPVIASDVGEGQFYRFPARRLAVSMSIPLK